MSQDIPVHTQKIGNILKEHCHQYIMPLYKNLKTSQIRKKDNGQDIVTDADEIMEQNLSRTLTQYLKSSEVLGEENYAKSPEIAENLESRKYIWVMDPLDGTRNFMQGKPEFCSMLALVKDGKTLAAWIYLPMQNRILIADTENGSYDDNNKKITVKRQNIKPADMIGQINFGLFAENIRSQRKAEAEATYKNIDRIFCAGYDFSGICLNRRHFSAYRHLWWWDHIPGAFILQQAGGTVRQMGKEKYSPKYPAKQLLVASDKEIADEITAFIGKQNPVSSAA